MGIQIKKDDEIPDVLLINAFYAKDERGCFSKIYEESEYNNAGLSFEITETFFSVSSRGVIRGMHFQTTSPQAKIVSVLKGRAFDVVIDLRTGSPTYRKWKGYELSEHNHMAVYVPKGFAHGFLSLEDDTMMLYQCEGKYDPGSDTGIRYDDPVISVKWPVDEIEKIIVSDRDLSFSKLSLIDNSLIQ